MAEQSDTLVFVPAWNEEENLPAVLEELHERAPGADVLVVDDGSTDGTASVAAEHGAEVLSFGANRGLPRGDLGRLRLRGRARVRVLRRASTRTGSIRPTSSGACSSACARTRATSPSGSRYASGDGFEARRYEADPARARLGTAVLRRSMKVALRRPFLRRDQRPLRGEREGAARSLARPYDSTAPEVQALLRAADGAGFRVDEVPVHMRERASGESSSAARRRSWSC